MNELENQQNNNSIQDIMEDLIFKQEQIYQIQNYQEIKHNEVLLQSNNDKITEIVTFLQECQHQGITINCSELNKIDFRLLSMEYLEKLMTTYKEIAKEEKEEDKLYTKRQYLTSKLPCNLMPYLNQLFPYDIFYSIEFISDEETININHKADLKEFEGAKRIFIKKDKVFISQNDALPFSIPPVYDPRAYQGYFKRNKHGGLSIITNDPKTKTVYINGDRAHATNNILGCNSHSTSIVPFEFGSDKNEYAQKTGIEILTMGQAPETKYYILFSAECIYEKLSQDFYDKHRFDIKALCEDNLNSENLENILTQYSNALNDMQINVGRRNIKVRKP